MTPGPTSREQALDLVAAIVVKVERRIAAVAAERARQAADATKRRGRPADPDGPSTPDRRCQANDRGERT
jgi:hypothetical protein